MDHSLSKLLGASLLLGLGLVIPLPGIAQNQALDLARDKNTEMHPTLREGLSTLGRYAESVNRQVNSLSNNRNSDPAPVANGEPEAPPKANPARQRRLDITNDPFEVSPQLREGRSFGSRYTGAPGASVLELQRQVQLRALLTTPHGKAAMLSIKNTETITVMDKELIDLGPLGTFLIQIDRDGVSLFNPSAPQGKKVVLR
jgi:hypothetical protein